MQTRRLAVLALVLVLAPAAAALSPEIDRALRDAKYVYIQSERKSGDFGAPAEIWFLYDKGAVVVGTRPASWRVRRIRAGRTRARIAVGTKSGPTFEARGAVVQDPALEERLLAVFAEKYPEGWAFHEKSFLDGFATGQRVLVRYVPAAAP